MAKLKRTGNWSNFKRTAIGNAIDAVKVELIPEIRAALLRHYSKTFAYWRGLGMSATTGKRPYPVPLMHFDYAISYDGKGIVIKIRTFATLGNVPHTLWYWLDKGTKDTVQPHASPPIPAYTTTRTRPNSLEVESQASFTGEFFRIAEGKIRRGIAARNWSELIGKFSIRDLQRDLDEYGFTVKTMIVNGKKTSVR